MELHLDLLYEEENMWILDRCLKILRRKEVLMVKVLWSKRDVKEVTWERENEMKVEFCGLFEPAIT